MLSISEVNVKKACALLFIAFQGAYGFSTWSSYNPCITSGNASIISGDRSCDTGWVSVIDNSDVGDDDQPDSLENKVIT